MIACSLYNLCQMYEYNVYINNIYLYNNIYVYYLKLKSKLKFATSISCAKMNKTKVIHCCFQKIVTFKLSNDCLGHIFTKICKGIQRLKRQSHRGRNIFEKKIYFNYFAWRNYLKIASYKASTIDKHWNTLLDWYYGEDIACISPRVEIINKIDVMWNLYAHIALLIVRTSKTSFDNNGSTR